MVITTIEEYNNLINKMNREKCILTPIFIDTYYHQVENSILCAAVAFKNEVYIISISHSDAPQFPCPTCELNDTDIKMLAYVHGKPIEEVKYSSYVQDTYNQFGELQNINKYVPLMVWSTALKEYAQWQWNIITECEVNDIFYTHKSYNETLREIERFGICVDKELLTKYFGNKVTRCFKSDMVYTQYNPYTTTGRPSNRFGGINFSALNKSDGSRAAFISRYPNGTLVQFDYEAYHLRLIADAFGIQLPDTSLHTMLAQTYFNTNDITDDLYAEGKRKTFEIIYGISNETYGIDLFKKIVELRQNFKNTSGELILPSGITVHINDPSPSKMFNYYVQSLEIVKTIPKLQQVLKLLKDTHNHLILYTYDSILLDMQKFDRHVITQIMEILEENKKFPVRVHAGTNYDNITEIRL